MGRVPQLDGIRGVAIALVIGHHYFFSKVDGSTHGSWHTYLILPFRWGWTGVDLFFVLSGYLISGILYDHKDAEHYYQTFYARRLLRIIPLYFLWLLCFAAGVYLTAPGDTTPLRDIFNRDIPMWSYPLFLQNVFEANLRQLPPRWLSHTWSLAVEEQFYVLLPLSVRYLNKRGIVYLALTAIAAAPVFRILYNLAGNNFYGPYTMLPCRADSLGLGVLLAMAVREESVWHWIQNRRRWLYQALPVLGIAVLYTTRNLQGYLVNSVGYTLVAAFFGVLFLLVLVQPTKLELTLFCYPPLVWLGLHAYGLYIAHHGINNVLHYLIRGAARTSQSWQGLAVTLLSLFITLLIAAAAWRWIEAPLIRLGHAKFRYGSREAEMPQLEGQ